MTNRTDSTIELSASVNLFGSILTEDQKTNGQNGLNSDTSKGKRALRDVHILENILIDPDSAILRKRIIDIANQRGLTCSMTDRSSFYFKILTSIPATRKITKYKPFPQALVNGWEYNEDGHSSFFFMSNANHSPNMEVIKIGVQPCLDLQKNVPFILFRSPNSSSRKDVHMGIFHLRTIGLSVKALKDAMSAEEFSTNLYTKQLSPLLNRSLAFKANRTSHMNCNVHHQGPLQVQGRLNIAQHSCAFGTSSHPFGFYSQEINIYEAANGDNVMVDIHYDHFRNPSKKFSMWTTSRSGHLPDKNQSTELWVNDIYITTDTIAPLYEEEEKFFDPFEDSYYEQKGPPSYETSASLDPPPIKPSRSKEEVTSSESQKFKLRPKRQKVIVDLGDNRYMLTSVDILATMVNNKLMVENPRFDLPQRDKNFKDWLREKQEKLFPTLQVKPRASELILPS